jgi:tetratricopeptide (TPR) repeat protein
MRNQHKLALGLLLAMSVSVPVLAQDAKAPADATAATPVSSDNTPAATSPAPTNASPAGTVAPAAAAPAAAPTASGNSAPADKAVAPAPVTAAAKPLPAGDYTQHLEAGKAAAKKADNAKALDELKAALQLAEASNDLFRIAESNNEIANVYMAQQDIEHAAEYARRGKDTAIKLLFKDPKTQQLANQFASNEENGSIWINHVMQAEFAAQRKDYAAAENQYQAAIAKAKEYAEDGMPMATALTGLGKTYVAEGKYQEAEPVLRKAIELCEKNWTPVTKNAADDGADAMDRLALVLEKTGRKAEGDKFAGRAKKVRETKSFK